MIYSLSITSTHCSCFELASRLGLSSPNPFTILSDVSVHLFLFPDMISLALRLLAITSALYGVVFCAQVSSTTFLRSTRKNIIMDQENMLHTNPKPHRPQLTIDTSMDSDDAPVIIEITPRATYTITEFFTAALQLSIALLSAFDLRSERALRFQKRLARSQYQWAASSTQFSPAIV